VKSPTIFHDHPLIKQDHPTIKRDHRLATPNRRRISMITGWSNKFSRRTSVTTGWQ